MNELKRIHLAKVPYEIERDAHAALKDYLKEIEGRVAAEVASEVEVRITEILAERGTPKDGVIVKADVEAIIAQLGTPEQFSDDAQEVSAPKGLAGRQLMRDTDRALIGGVASGLGAYFSVDPIIFRLLFLGLTFAGGSGILLYLIAWLIIPEPKSDADRLRMRGKEVTVEALAKLRDGVSGVSGRFGGGRLGDFILASLRFIAGFGLVALAATVLVSFVVGASLVLRYPLYGEFPGQVVDYVIGGAAAAAVFAGTGLAAWAALHLFRGKVPGVHSKALGYGLFTVAVVAFLASLSTTVAFLPDIRQRYKEVAVTEVRDLPSFTALAIEGDGMYRYVATADQPHLEISMQIDGTYPAVKAEVVDGTLRITDLEDEGGGHPWFSDDFRDVTVYGPALEAVSLKDDAYLRLTPSSVADSFTAAVANTSSLYFSGSNLRNLTLTASESASFSADRAVVDAARVEAGPETDVSFGRVMSLDAKVPSSCLDPIIRLYDQGQSGSATINGQKVTLGDDRGEECTVRIPKSSYYSY